MAGLLRQGMECIQRDPTMGSRDGVPALLGTKPTKSNIKKGPDFGALDGAGNGT